MDNNKKKVDQLRLNIHELTNCRRNSNDDNSALEFISEIVANIIKDWDEPPKQVDSVCACPQGSLCEFFKKED